jgi:tetratricopeptide (TPR) repeat protein
MYGKHIHKLIVLSACTAVFSLFCAANWQDMLRSIPEKAEQAYTKEDYDKALKLYQEAQTRNPDSDTLAYNLGNTLYKLGKYDEAARQFGKILEKDSAAIAPKAIYNMGNSLFKMGQETQNQEFLQNALEAFKHSIISDPQDEDSKYNYELTRRLIREQEQQQQQQQKNQDKQDHDKKQQDQQQQQNQDQKQDQNEDQKQQQARQQQADQQEQQEQQPRQGEMSEQEAEKILQALIQMEKEAREDQEKKQQAASSSKGRDW